MAGKPADSCSGKIGSNEKEKSKSDRRKSTLQKSLSLEEKKVSSVYPKGFISKNICKNGLQHDWKRQILLVWRKMQCYNKPTHKCIVSQGMRTITGGEK